VCWEAAMALGKLGYSGVRVFRRRRIFWSRFIARSVAELAFGTSGAVPPSSNGRPAGPPLPVAAPTCQGTPTTTRLQDTNCYKPTR
jgi:hypothetical protein